jgi:hypothetical protein
MLIGRRVIETKPRPSKIISMLKGLDSRKELVARAKNLKDVEIYSKPQRYLLHQIGQKTARER